MKRKQNMVMWLGTIGVICASLGMAAAQSRSISGMYVFPKRNQPPEQQQQDEMQCHSSAVEMTGFNPTVPPSSPPPSQGAPTGSGARGAVRGASLPACTHTRTSSRGGANTPYTMPRHSLSTPLRL